MIRTYERSPTIEKNEVYSFYHTMIIFFILKNIISYLKKLKIIVSISEMLMLYYKIISIYECLYHNIQIKYDLQINIKYWFTYISTVLSNVTKSLKVTKEMASIYDEDQGNNCIPFLHPNISSFDAKSRCRHHSFFSIMDKNTYDIIKWNYSKSHSSLCRLWCTTHSLLFMRWQACRFSRT